MQQLFYRQLILYFEFYLFRFRREIQYKNRYTSSNYNCSTSDVRNVSKKCDTKAIGSIQMDEKSQMLSEVSIIGEYPLVRVIDGKMTYNMSQLLTDKMATSIYDAILKLPGIQIQKGTFQLIGANNVTILINGKKTNMDENQLNNLLKICRKSVFGKQK